MGIRPAKPKEYSDPQEFLRQFSRVSARIAKQVSERLLAIEAEKRAARRRYEDVLVTR